MNSHGICKLCYLYTAMNNGRTVQIAAMLKLLRRGGRCTSSGTIVDPVVALDMRDMYLKDISLIGTTAWNEAVFPEMSRSFPT